MGPPAQSISLVGSFEPFEPHLGVATRCAAQGSEDRVAQADL
jgi:hypothetical protein